MANKRQKVDLDELCINSVRVLSVEMVQQAKSGHPGAPMGCAPMAYALFTQAMNYSPSNPRWYNRDRFILSNGHSCALLYSMLHLTGYERPTMDDIKQFRQLNSVTAGHPENHLLDGVEVATGPLGQGISNAVGLAMASNHMAATFNEEGHELINNFTYVICGDGCLQEGVSSEACSLAGHLKLGRLIVLYDDNSITIDGNTNISFTEDVGKRYEAYGWQVLTVEDGDSSDISNIVKAIEEAKACSDKPTIIKIKTTIGFGAAKENTAKVHGAPLGWDDIKNVRTKFGLDPEAKFSVPEQVVKHMGEQKVTGQKLEDEWNNKFEAYKIAFPEKAKELERRIKGELPENWEKVLPTWKPEDKALASRASSGKVLNALAPIIPELVGGSADLTGSNLTNLDCSHDFQPNTPDGRYFRFGVREHAMAAICNGMAAYRGVIPFCATFLTFVGYALGSIRLSALSEWQVIYIMTHDSIGLGEDGPTHQAIETLASLRSMPNMYVFRPADANEVAGSYKAALNLRKSPSVFALSRQGLTNYPGSSADSVSKGAYVLLSSDAPKVTFVATGSEVGVAVDAAKKLQVDGVSANVVSMPCFELFESQTEEYKKSVFLDGVPVVSVEAAATFGWERYSHVQIGMTTFGKSAPAGELFKEFGFTVENLTEKANLAIAKYAGKAPSKF